MARVLRHQPQGTSLEQVRRTGDGELMALRDFFFWRGRGKGGRCRRERSVSRVPGGMLRPKPKNSRCRSSARHGRLRVPVFAGGKRTERGTDGVAASLGEGEARERAAKRYATKP